MEKQRSEKQEVVFLSLLASAFLTFIKLAAGLWSGSLALLAEAGHSLLDFCVTCVTFYTVRFAEKPADEDHPYGHNRAEAIVAFAETVLLFI